MKCIYYHTRRGTANTTWCLRRNTAESALYHNALTTIAVNFCFARAATPHIKKAPLRVLLMAERKGLRTYRPPVKPAPRRISRLRVVRCRSPNPLSRVLLHFHPHIKKAPLRVLLMAERKGLRTYRPPVKPAARHCRACASFAVAHRTHYQGVFSTFTRTLKKHPCGCF